MIDTEQEKDHEKALFTDEFHAKDYIADYYPPIADKDIQSLINVYNAIGEGSQEQGFSIEIGDFTRACGVQPEIVENVSSIFFQKKILEYLLIKGTEKPLVMLDIGGGPTIYQHILLAPYVGSIYHAEFTPQNRDEVISWVNKDERAHNWRSYFTFIHGALAQDENFSRVYSEAKKKENAFGPHKTFSQIGEIIASVNTRKENLRHMLSHNMLPCDVFKESCDISADNLLDAFPEGSTGILTSHFVVESATAEKEKWLRGMGNILGLLRKEDFIVQSFISGSEWYKNGDRKMPALKVTEKMIKDVYAKHNCEVLYCGTIEGSNIEETGYSGMIFMFAKKTK